MLISQDDENAFRELFHFYRPAIYTSLRMAGDSEWAKDIYQDIFLRVWLKREMLPTIENFAGWLFIVARNIMLDALQDTRSKSPNPLNQVQDIQPDLSYDPDGILQYKELQTVLTEAIRRLPVRQRETYEWIKVEGLSRSETAARMNISPETVKWNLEQAMRSIRAYCLKNMDFSLLLVLLPLLNN